MNELTCQVHHDWKEESNLRLTVEVGDEWLASIIPMPARMIPVDYCCQCGVVRIRPAFLAALNQRESELGQAKASHVLRSNG